MNKPVENILEVDVALPQEVSPEVAGDIEKESVFVSPFLDKIKVHEDRANVRLFVTAPEQIDVVREKVERFLAVMVRQIGGFDVKVFYENTRKDTGEYVHGVNEELVARGWVHDYGKGQVAYNGPVLKLARLIDRTAGELYAKAFGTKDGHFPAFVDLDTLQKCGYVDGHPNQVSFVGNIIEDFDAIEEFRVANSCSDGGVLPPHQHVHVGGMCLNPAACFPAYPTFEGVQIAEGGHAVSWMGRVFRYESRNVRGLERLYEFNVRELVWVGSEDYVRESRKVALPLIQQLIETIDLDAKIQTATDPFFATVSAAKKFWQQAQEVKNEILIPILKDDGSVKDMACGSINLHGNFFGTRFDITDATGAPAQTGCVGLGIERWVYAAFTQHGFNPQRWPEAVRNEIFAD